MGYYCQQQTLNLPRGPLRDCMKHISQLSPWSAGFSPTYSHLSLLRIAPRGLNSQVLLTCPGAGQISSNGQRKSSRRGWSCWRKEAVDMLCEGTVCPAQFEKHAQMPNTVVSRFLTYIICAIRKIFISINFSEATFWCLLWELRTWPWLSHKQWQIHLCTKVCQGSTLEWMKFFSENTSETNLEHTKKRSQDLKTIG